MPRELPGTAANEVDVISATTAPAMELNVLAVLNDVADSQIPFRELERVGYTVRATFARSLHEFSVRARAGAYDVMLALYPLRGWTVLELLSAMRELGIQTPVILIAAEVDETAIELMNAGASDYIVLRSISRLPLAVGRAMAEVRARRQRAGADDLIVKLTMAVNQSPASVLFTDVHGKIEYVNSRFSEITGYTFAEAVGNTPRLVSSGRNPRDLYADMWKTIRAGKVWRGELQNRKKNGELYWDSVSISPIRDSNGVITHFLGSQEDVTERKMGEQKVRDSEERFRQIAENVREVFFITSISLREMLYISPAYEQVWGRSCQSL